MPRDARLPFALSLLALVAVCPGAAPEGPERGTPEPAAPDRSGRLKVAREGGGGGSATASAQDLKALAFDLAHAGEFDAAREAFGRLAGMTGDPLARTAFFHLGNLLETSHVLDATTAAELEHTLEEARAAYARAVADMASAAPAARRQAEMNLDRVEEKLAGLREIGGRKLTPLEVSERLDDLDAPEAAAHSLRHRLDTTDPAADQFYFLTLVYRVAWLDHLYLRLANAGKLAERGGAAGRDRAAIDARIAARIGQLAGVSEDTEAIGLTAIRRYPASPHLLDLRILTADAHRYHAQLEAFRAASQAGRLQATAGDARPAVGDGESELAAGAGVEVPAAAIDQLELAVSQLRAARALVEEARRNPAILSPAQKAAWPPATLDLYAEQLVEQLASDEAMLGRVGQAAPPAAAGHGMD